jgi:hypothetical protein
MCSHRRRLAHVIRLYPAGGDQRIASLLNRVVNDILKLAYFVATECKP